MNFYAFSQLVNFFALSFLAVFVLLYDYKNKINQTYALVNICMAFWCFFYVLWQITPNYDTAFFLLKILMTFAASVPMTFLHFVYNFLSIKKFRNQILPLIYLWGFTCFILIYSNQLFDVMRIKMGIFWPDAGRFFNFYITYFFFGVLTAFYLLYKTYVESHGTRKNKLRYFVFAFALAIIGGSLNFPLWYDINIPPFLNLLITAYAIIVAFTILKHHLMDINIVIRKGLIYSVLLGLLSGIYLGGVYLISNLLGGIGTGRSAVFSIITIMLFAVFFQPLRDKVQIIIDKIFFRGKYDYQKTIRELSQAARTMIGIDALLDKVLTFVVDVIKIKNASIYVLNKKNKQYELRKAINPSVQRSILKNDDDLIEMLLQKKEALMCEEMNGYSMEADAAIIFPIFSKKELVGFMSLGEKLSGEVYSNEDIDLLSTLCNQVGISIENAMLYEDAMESQKHLYQADKLATMGTLAAGLAHEIKNPIAAIKGFSQVIDKAIEEKDKEVIEDFKSVVPRQLDRINDIVEKLLKLSKPAKMEKENMIVNNILDEIIKLVDKQAMKQRIKIVKNFEKVPQIRADAGQLSQAFLNLILNGMQSMPDGGKIEIRTCIDKSKIVVEFKDNGEGMSEEKLSKIFDPFYTTKESGSGLGLAVTQKIIKDHNGVIEVVSEEGKGTTFLVYLPAIM